MEIDKTMHKSDGPKIAYLKSLLDKYRKLVDLPKGTPHKKVYETIRDMIEEILYD